MKSKKLMLAKRLIFSVFAIIGLAACSNDDGPKNMEGNAKLALRLTDAPGNYDAVFIDVKDVEIKYNGNQGDRVLGIEGGIYNLLELTAGVNVLLFDNEVPAGDISQIGLILGDKNTVVIDGQTLPLSTPSAQQSGLKIKVKQRLEAGILYDFILDFNVDKSIVSQGNGEYSLKPVIRAITTAESGAISGKIVPKGISAMVTATDGDLEIASYTNLEGDFLLSGVPDGVYMVTVQTDVALEIPPLIINNVAVVKGKVTSLGQISLQ